MKKVFNKVLIVDGSYLLHRQLHQQTIFDLRGPNGERTGGIFGFLRSVNKEILNCSDYFPIVVFDHGLAKRRVEADPYYKKANERDTAEKLVTPEEIDNDYITQYRIQRNKLASLLPYFGIPVIMYTGWEGDDLIYLISKMSKESLVLTDDRDMLQLLTSTCNIRRPMADEYWTIDKFLKSRGFENIFDFVINKAILGDGSDNIPGSCKGVGDKYVVSLIKILKRYSTNRIENKWSEMDDYPVDEKSMKDLCQELGVSYRKAFLNFDRDRFIKNMELVDLILVDEDSKVLSSIEATVSDCKNKTDFFKLITELGNLGIREVPIDTIIESVSLRHKNLLEE